MTTTRQRGHCKSGDGIDGPTRRPGWRKILNAFDQKSYSQGHFTGGPTGAAGSFRRAGRVFFSRERLPDFL